MARIAGKNPYNQIRSFSLGLRNDNSTRDVPTHIVYVKEASDLCGCLSSDTVYFIDGRIDMGSESIVVPSKGLNLMGYGVSVSCIMSTVANHTLFVDGSPHGGSLYVSNMTIICPGANSKVMAIDNKQSGNNVVNFNNVCMINCASLGIMSNYGQFLCDNVFVSNCGDGFTFAGVWIGGAGINNLMIRDFGNAGTVFKKGNNLLFGSRFISTANMDLPFGAIGYNFDPSNFSEDSSFRLINGNYTGPGTVVGGTIDFSNVKSEFKGNTGLRNTFIGARWEVTSQEVTDITNTSDFVKAEGTTQYFDQEWFSNDGSNCFVYNSSLTCEFVIQGSISIASQNNHQIALKIRQWDNSENAYIDVRENALVTTNGGGRGENISILGFCTLDKNDRIELWVRNKTGSKDVTLLKSSLLSLSERF